MKVSILGAGAIGNLLAARLSVTGAEVSLIARGAALDEIRRNGVTMVTPLRRVFRATPQVTDDPHALGPQDVVFVCVKAHALRGALGTLTLLMDGNTTVVPMINGIPWWYPYGQPGPLADRPLESVDPGGILWRTIDPEQVVGSAAFVAVENDGPGRIRHISDQRFVFGDVGGRPNPMVGKIVDLFGKAGFQPRSTANIREAIWVKLWGNLGFNPLSVLTGATLGELCLDPGTRAVGRAMMMEAQMVADRLGVAFETSVDQRIAMAAGIGDFKTSMLQDFEAGRRLETAAIIGAVIELAERVGTAIPTIEGILALVEMRVRTRDTLRQSAA
ncbi:2-dehydropantoate 2-reductase [Telmatospirillum sp.]|uniref:ketopantoate reductase family protein n=1 Tax=Telmatospirillum sp. TaxID=2079197 RepID=UPI00284C8007|nr:2-dehydropantoate 2-reductase [Telmatospirillum sp.]MDR3441029.1 2-dehydropantoate 2-reductase [Telmatospirillum sp.]